MSEIRVLLANVSSMFQSLISAVLVQDEGIGVAGRIAESQHIDSAIEATRADVVIIGDQTPEAAPSYEDVLLRHPRVRLLLITTGGQDGYLYALKPTLTPLPRLSATTLLAAIRDHHGSQAADPPGGLG